jgi:hypothetical protein
MLRFWLVDTVIEYLHWATEDRTRRPVRHAIAFAFFCASAIGLVAALITLVIRTMSS